MSDLPRLAFIHIPKTAGTSVRDFFAKIYGDAVFPGMTTLDYACYSDEQLAEYRFFSGHAYHRDFTRLPPDTKLFTIFRNPVQRAISLYRYYAGIENTSDDPFIREAIDIAKNKGIIDFVYSNNPFLIEHLRAGQIRQFIGDRLLQELGHRRSITDDLEQRLWVDCAATLARFSYVITLDYLAPSLRLMCAVFRSHSNHLNMLTS